MRPNISVPRHDDAEDTGQNRLRVAAISFLNPAPLMWDFNHAPLQAELATRYAVSEMPPSRCAEQLATGAADIGLVPIAAYASIPGLSIVPGCAVASKGSIRSLLLIHREAGGIDAIRTVAADTSSRATFAYVQILFKRFWQVPVSFAPQPPNLDVMLEACDAAILIGDPALIALEDRDAREQRTGDRLVYLDLARSWREATGLPWVSAFWAVRYTSVTTPELRKQVRTDFLASCHHGLAHLEDLVQEWAPRIAVPKHIIRTYLHENIHYVLDDECVAAIEQFYRLAAECGVLPPAPPFSLL